ISKGKKTDKILSADKDYPEPHEAGPENIIPSDLDLIAVDFDNPARRQRTKHWSRGAVYKKSVGTIEKRKLSINVFAIENRILPLENDDKNVWGFAILTAAPLGRTKVGRRRESNLGRSLSFIQLAKRELPWLNLIFVTVRCNQQIEPRPIVEQHPAARH